jgi:hypothetical protein
MNLKKLMKRTAVAAMLLCPIPALWADAIPVTLENQGGSYRLLRGGEPYAIKGAGLEFSDIGVLASHGGNSIRTWRTDNAQFTGQELLDEAHRNGVSVALCIEIGRERHGFDYDDEEAVAAQLEYARGEVLKYRDHPAVLVWMIGNEPNLFFKNPKVFDAINEISEMIHELDPNHPTTTALAGFGPELAGLIETRAPDLDFVSVQFYGDIVNLPRYIDEIGWEKPYMVTEWGAIGHWEVRKTAWGAPVEQNSSEKAANYAKSHEIAIASNPDQVIGSYVFLWGQKQERTPTWYGMLLEDGSKTETIDVMEKIWTGAWPENRSPQVASMTLDSRTSASDIVLSANSPFPAQIAASDPDGDTLSYRWVVMRESQSKKEGGDKEETPEIMNGLVDHPDQNEITLTTPKEPGAYRLFAYVHDGEGSAGHANIPFLVK